MDKSIINLIENFLEETKKTNGKPLLVILGPTASGKTALSIEVAKRFNGEIISADSRQVYRHMDIGTDKIPMEKREDIPHYLIDVADPDERFTAVDFKREAEASAEKILAKGKLPMVVGGTGLYIRSLTENFSIPKDNPAVRAKIMKDLELYGKEKLHERLKKLDPANAAKIHPNNIPYVVRALEILIATGKPKNDTLAKPNYRCLKIGLNWPRETLFERINKRVDEQIAAGLAEETKRLLEMGYAKDLASMSSLGYREMIQYLEGKLTMEAAVEELKKNTRNFAKRQTVWFKKEPNVVSISLF